MIIHNDRPPVYAFLGIMVRIVKKASERKSDIIQAARRLFLARGFEATSMKDVMEALGIAKGTIYHYFESKEALLEAVVEDIVNENISQTKEFLKNARGNALDKIQVLIERGSIAEENVHVLNELNRPGNAGMHLRLLAATIIKQAEIYAEVIQQGCAEGIFQTKFPLECAEFILSAVQFLTDLGIYPWNHQDLLRRVKAFPQLIEQQLGAPKGSFQFLHDLF